MSLAIRLLPALLIVASGNNIAPVSFRADALASALFMYFFRGLGYNIRKGILNDNCLLLDFSLRFILEIYICLKILAGGNL